MFEYLIIALVGGIIIFTTWRYNLESIEEQERKRRKNGEKKIYQRS